MMHEVPECLNRRYRAVDELINDLVSSMPNKCSDKEATGLSRDDPSVKLMCEFWNILKENPDCDLPKAVYEQLCQNVASSCHFVDMPTKELSSSPMMSPVSAYSPPAARCFQPQRFACYMACDGRDQRKPGTCSKCSGSKQKCYMNPDNSGGGKSPSSSANAEDKLLPLSKVLCDLKEAASFDQQCNERLNELMETEADIQAQIEQLEKREAEGTQMLKQADCMWACMEETYKRKVAESLSRQKELLQHAQQIEKSTAKWRKSKKDLELQMVQLMKCQDEIKEKVNQKTNDMKIMDKEIADFKKRIDNNIKDTKDITNSLAKKKANSDSRMAAMAQEKQRLEEQLADEKNRKSEKEAEGNKYIKEAREELQKICRVLLQKRLENQDLLAERDALIQEIEMLKSTCDQCKMKCKTKESSIENEIKTLDKEIKEYKQRCIQCHECVDTSDVRKFCNDCPRCLQERECLYNTGDCTPDHSLDCVCQSVKKKFLDNVFENMYTVLENETRTGHGQEVAETVLDCLKRSRNGKLDSPTREILQNFILTTIKKNLNLTIVGGAVKTRCEMDASTYEQLMACLKNVQVTKPPKEDKGTLPRKEPCKQWGGANECNCPKGPDSCICTKKAPKRRGKGESGPCPDYKEEDNGEAEVCPHKDKPCSSSCGVRGFSNRVGADVSAWRPDPCKRKTCTYNHTMRAAQCVLGPELLHENTLAKRSAQFADTSKRQQSTPGREVSPTRSPKRGEKQLKAGIVSESQKGGQDTSNKNKPNKQKRIVTNRKDSIIQVQISNPNRPVMSGTQTIKGSVGKNTECSTSLIRTSSGKMAVELDDKLIDKIEKRIKDSSATLVTLRETSSGNFLIDFNPKNIDSDNSQKAFLKRSLSGKLSLEIEKKLINSLISDVKPNKVDTSSSISIGLVKKSKNSKDKGNKSTESNLQSTEEKSRNKKVKDGLKVYRKPVNTNENKRCKYEEMKKMLAYNHASCSSIETDSLSDAGAILDVMKMHRKISLTQYLTILDEACQRGEEDIDLIIHGDNDVVAKVKAKIIKSPSGYFSLYIKDSENLENLTENDKDHLSLIKLSESGTYELYLEPKSFSKAPNTIVKKTTEGLSINFTKSILKSLASDFHIPVAANTHKIYKLNVKANSGVMAVPAFLKVTPSANYVLVLDKEFEVEYKNKFKKCFNNETVCYTELSFTSSNTVCINFEMSGSQVSPLQNALLLRSPSGNIKVYVNGPIFESLLKKSRKDTKTTQRILNKFLENKTKDKQRLNITQEKSNSDTVLYEKDIRNNRNQNQIMNSLASLKKTDSGQYEIILNKESKKHFIKNLMNNLSSSVQGVTPVSTGAQSGEITISMGNKDGSLKISPSGNMYALVSEKTVNEIITDKDDEHSAASKVLRYIIGKEIQFNDYSSNEVIKNTSSHIIQKNKNPQDKCISTNCRAECKENTSHDCDTANCFCKKNDNISLCNTSLNTITEKCDSKNLQQNSKIYFCTHMTNKPYLSTGSKNQKCFYFDESDDASVLAMSNNTDDDSFPYSHLDTLGNLPPQLPPFLQGDFK